MDKRRRSIMVAGALAAGSGWLLQQKGAGAEDGASPPYPQGADTSAASPELVAFITSFFSAKSSADLERTMSHFSSELATYTDASLGMDLNYDGVKETLGKYMPTWPATAKSYPTRIIGGMNGAMVAFTNTPELFGGELRAMASIDIKDWKIVRWVDIWDGRGWPNAYGFQKSPLSNYHESEVGENSSETLQNVARKLTRAMSSGDAAAAAALFSFDAVYEDVPLRSFVPGRAAIQRYFERALVAIPNGVGATLRHTVGNDLGGGFEWNAAPDSVVKTGVTAIVLDGSGLISRATSVYDGALFDGPLLRSLAALSLEP